jgi:antitoxin YefM
MQSTYRVKADELTEDFLQALKATYRDREIEITVQEVPDETEYLLRSEANRQHLLEAIKNANDPAKRVEVPLESLEE